MNDTQFNKGIEQLKHISLSQSEKQKMLSEITVYADFHAPKTTPKKSVEFWSWSFFQAHSALAVRALTLVLIVGGTSYMADKSLPGDILYPFKVNVNEPLYGSLLKTEEDKAAWNSNRFIRRLEEAEALARDGKLNESSLAEVERQIDARFADIQGTSQNSIESAAFDTSVASDARMAGSQAKFAASAQEPESATPTLMMQANMQTEFFATTTEEKDALEQKIEEHTKILESLIRDGAGEHNVLIRRLQIKLEEKASLRSQNK